MMPLTVPHLRSGWVEFLSHPRWTHAVTLKPNHKTERATAQFLRGAFLRFGRDVDQTLLGPRYHRPAKRHLRTEAVGIMEGLPSTGHIHAVFRVLPSRWEDFENLFRSLSRDLTIKPTRANPWAARIVGGTSKVSRITNAEGWASYCTKELTNLDAADRIMFLPLES